jgi:hypothetical protein
MRIHLLSCLAGALLAAGTVAAQTITVRTLPEDAKRGQLSHVRENVMTLDGRETTLAPGAQIRGQNNLLVLPAALPRDSLVKYQVDREGALFRAWVLTADEAARPDKFAPAAVQGRPVDQVLPQYAPPQPARFGDKPPAPPAPPPAAQN